MKLQEIKEYAIKEVNSMLDDNDVWFGEWATRINILDLIDSIITKSFEEGRILWEKEVNKRVEKYITLPLWYACPDFRIWQIKLWHNEIQ